MSKYPTTVVQHQRESRGKAEVEMEGFLGERGSSILIHDVPLQPAAQDAARDNTTW